METAPPRDIHPQLLVDMTHEAHEHAMASMLIKDLQFPVDIYDVQVKRRRAARACVFVKRGGRRMPHRCRKSRVVDGGQRCDITDRMYEATKASSSPVSWAVYVPNSEGDRTRGIV
jgi:hypothetical protein